MDINKPKDTSSKILIADRELITAFDLKQFLENAGYKVLPVVNKKNKLIEVALLERPGLIITDIDLDGTQNGLSAINEINKESIFPVIYLTTNLMFNPNVFLKILDSLAVLNKPIDYNKLLYYINKKLFQPASNKLGNYQII